MNIGRREEQRPPNQIRPKASKYRMCDAYRAVGCDRTCVERCRPRWRGTDGTTAERRRRYGPSATGHSRRWREAAPTSERPVRRRSWRRTRGDDGLPPRTRWRRTVPLDNTWSGTLHASRFFQRSPTHCSLRSCSITFESKVRAYAYTLNRIHTNTYEYVRIHTNTYVQYFFGNRIRVWNTYSIFEDL